MNPNIGRDNNAAADLSFEDELGDDDRVLFGDGAGLAEVSFQVRVRVRYAHGGAAQHVRRTHKTREAHTVAEVDGRLQIRQLLPPDQHSNST